MPTKAYVQGLSEEGNKLTPVFNEDCQSLVKIQEAIELAFEAGATKIIITRKKETRLGAS